MQRIGIAASKIAKGNLFIYNITVFIIVILCALLLFFVCGFAILAALLGIFALLRLFVPGVDQAWVYMIKLCFTVLTGLVGGLSIVALIKNLKWKK